MKAPGGVAQKILTETSVESDEIQNIRRSLDSIFSGYGNPKNGIEVWVSDDRKSLLVGVGDWVEGSFANAILDEIKKRFKDKMTISLEYEPGISPSYFGDGARKAYQVYPTDRKKVVTFESLIQEYTYKGLLKAIDWDFIHMRKHYEEARRRGVQYVPYNQGSPSSGSNGQYIFFKTPLSPKSKKRGYNQDAWYQTMRLMDFEEAMESKDQKLRDKVNLAISGDMQIHCTCFTGDVRVPLLDGRTRSFKELHEEYGSTKPFWVYSSDEQGNFVPKRATCLGVTRKTRNLVRVTLDNGESFTCTPDHKLRMKDGSYVAAGEAPAGTSLLPLYTRRDPMGYQEVKVNSSARRWTKTYREVALGLFSVEYEAGILRASLDGSTGVSVHHLNENKDDNRPENLKWVTCKEHIAAHGFSSLSKKKRRLKTDISMGTPEGREAIRKMKSAAGKLSQTLHPENRDNIEKAIEWVRENGSVLSERMRRLWEERPEEMLQKSRAALNTEEVRSKQRQGMTQYWQNQEEKLRRTSQMRAVRGTTETRRKSKEKQLAVWKDETLRKKHSVIMKAVWERRRNPQNHKIVSVEVVECKEDIPVYCLNVEDTHNFAIAAGVYVKNCPAFNYWGYRYIVTQLGTDIYGQAIEPKVRNPKMRGIMCKHLALVLSVLPFWIPEVTRDLRVQGFDTEEGTQGKEQEKPNV